MGPTAAPDPRSSLPPDSSRQQDTMPFEDTATNVTNAAQGRGGGGVRGQELGWEESEGDDLQGLGWGRGGGECHHRADLKPQCTLRS